jgi:hypothetical protein
MVNVTYRFAELSDAARQRAIEWFRECVTQDWEPDDIIADAVNLFGHLGIEFGVRTVKLMNGKTRQEPNVAYSIGFVQGDYATFTGHWVAERMHYAALLEQAPEDAELKRVGAQLMSVMLRYPLASCQIAPFSLRVSIDTAFTGECDDDGGQVDLDEDTFATVEACMEALAAWLYQRMADELLYHGSEQACIEGIEANEYTFDEDGKPI